MGPAVAGAGLCDKKKASTRPSQQPKAQNPSCYIDCSRRALSKEGQRKRRRNGGGEVTRPSVGSPPESGPCPPMPPWDPLEERRTD
jgi:hypothetical protein